MSIIAIGAGECGEGEYAGLVPGSRVAYRGTLWKVVGMYFAPGPHNAEDGVIAVPGARKGTKYLILRSLEMAPEGLQSLGAARSP